MAVRVEPDNVEFSIKGFHGASPQTTTIRLINDGPNRICYKVKLTSPKRYLVRPKSGVIPVNSSVEVDILVRNRRGSDAVPSAGSKDTFLFMTVEAPAECDDETAASIVESSVTDQKASKLRVRVTFITSEDTSATTSPLASARATPVQSPHHSPERLRPLSSDEGGRNRQASVVENQTPTMPSSPPPIRARALSTPPAPQPGLLARDTRDSDSPLRSARALNKDKFALSDNEVEKRMKTVGGVATVPERRDQRESDKTLVARSLVVAQKLLSIARSVGQADDDWTPEYKGGTLRSGDVATATKKVPDNEHVAVRGVIKIEAPVAKVRELLGDWQRRASFDTRLESVSILEEITKQTCFVRECFKAANWYSSPREMLLYSTWAELPLTPDNEDMIVPVMMCFSTTHPDCPADEKQRFVRATMYWGGFVLIPSGEDGESCQVVFAQHVDYRGNSPTILQNQIALEAPQMIRRLRALLVPEKNTPTAKSSPQRHHTPPVSANDRAGPSGPVGTPPTEGSSKQSGGKCVTDSVRNDGEEVGGNENEADEAGKSEHAKRLEEERQNISERVSLLQYQMYYDVGTLAWAYAAAALMSTPPVDPIFLILSVIRSAVCWFTPQIMHIHIILPVLAGNVLNWLLPLHCWLATPPTTTCNLSHLELSTTPGLDADLEETVGSRGESGTCVASWVSSVMCIHVVTIIASAALTYRALVVVQTYTQTGVVGFVRVEEEQKRRFQLACLNVKLSAQSTGKHVASSPTDELFLQARREGIPEDQWEKFLWEQLTDPRFILPQSTHRTAPAFKLPERASPNSATERHMVFLEHYQQGDITLVEPMLHERVRLSTPSGNVIEGRQDVASHFQAMMSKSKGCVHSVGGISRVASSVTAATYSVQRFAIHLSIRETITWDEEGHIVDIRRERQ